MYSRGGVIDLEAADLAFGRSGLFHFGDGSVAGVADNVEDVADPIRRLAAETGPGDVVVNGVRAVEFGPHIEEDQVAGFHRGVGSGTRLVVGVTRMRVNADDGAVVRDQAGGAKSFENEIAHRYFVYAGGELFGD